jgi:hypothetical protein
MVGLSPPLSGDDFNTQRWKFECVPTDSECDLFGVTNLRGHHIGVYKYDNQITFGEEFYLWGVDDYDETILNRDSDDEPRGTVIAYTNPFKKFKHRDMDKILSVNSDHVVLSEYYNELEEIWEIESLRDRSPAFLYDSLIRLYGTNLVLTETKDGEIILTTISESPTWNQRWLLKTSSIKNIVGMQNVKSWKYLFTNGSTLRTSTLAPGWNSWEVIDVDSSNRNKTITNAQTLLNDPLKLL